MIVRGVDICCIYNFFVSQFNSCEDVSSIVVSAKRSCFQILCTECNDSSASSSSYRDVYCACPYAFKERDIGIVRFLQKYNAVGVFNILLDFTDSLQEPDIATKAVAIDYKYTQLSN